MSSDQTSAGTEEHRETSMEWYEIKELLAISAMIVVVLIPVVGLTARFTLGPLIDKFARLRSGNTDTLAEEVRELRHQVAHLQAHVEVVESQVRHLREVRDFDRSLAPGPSEQD